MHVHPRLIASVLVAAACGDSGAGPDAAASDATAANDAAAADAGPSVDARPRADATPGTVCEAPIQLQTGEGHLGSNRGRVTLTVASCAAGTIHGGETYYSIDVGSTPTDVLARVRVDESAEPPFDAVLSARSDCTDDETELACADAGWSDRLEVLDALGEVFLIVDGSDQFGGQAEGDYTLHVDTREVVGEDAACDPNGVASRCGSDLRCVDAVCVPDSAALACAEAIDVTDDLADGQASLHGATHAYDSDFHQASCAFDPDGGFGEALVRFDLAETADLVATTNLPGTDFDTVLTLKDACDGAELACHDDIDLPMQVLTSRLEAPALPAGSYVLVVDGSSPSPGTGSFELSLSATAPAP